MSETITLEPAKASCGRCESYATRESVKPIVVRSCEGACLRGELARLAANKICDELAPDRTARLCLGGAFTKDTGQRNLARRAERVVAIEGCPTDCGSRIPGCSRYRGGIEAVRPAQSTRGVASD